MKRWLTVPEVATYFSLSRSQVYELVSLGKFTVLRPDKTVSRQGIRVSMESVQRFESINTIQGDDAQ